MLAGKQPELCVAAIHSICATYLPPILPKFCRNYPEVLVTTSDRMEIPPIKVFWQLVKELVPQQLDQLDNFPGWKAKLAK